MNHKRSRFETGASKQLLMGACAALTLAAGSASGLQFGEPKREPSVQETELQNAAQEQAGGEVIQISQFSEAVELSVLVGFFADVLQINVTQDGQLSGTVSFNAPVDIPREDALTFLDSILGDRGYTIVRDDTGWYKVQQTANVGVGLSDIASATTRVIYTKNVRPTSIQTIIQTQLAGTSARLSYVDELGFIMVTGAPRQIEDVKRIVNALIDERSQLDYQRIELQYLSAPVARDRMIELATGTTTTIGRPGVNRQGVPGQEQLGGGGNISSLANRLSVDQQDNALLFLGRDDEVEEIKKLAALVDTPSRLTPVRYFTGSATQNIAQIAEETGLGELVQLRATDGNSITAQIEAQQRAQGIQTQQDSGGGSRLVASPDDGYIVYYGTEQQQTQFESLIEQFETEADIVVTTPYKLEHADAEEVADLLQGLIQNERPIASDSGSLLPPGRNTNDQNQRQDFQQDQAQTLAALSGALAFNPDPDISFVIPDTARNQVFVKAPIRQQEQFAKLIDAIDIRRPQVYLEVQIVSVSATDSFILSFEQQIISTSGGEGVFNTNFGSSSGADITIPRTVGALTGLSAAIINSDQVPLVINALRSNSDTRIVASPKLLVDDNEEAEIVSIRQEPTTITRTLDSGQQITEFQGYEDAGTELTITPRISEGEHLTLNYNIELSSFEASDGTDAGVPPPRSENTIRADSVTIPAGMTIVVGGLRTENSSRTVAKVPLLGDIPILGELFTRRSNADDATTLYVFLTPTILRDPDFADYRLLTEGPQRAVSLPADLPRLMPKLARPLKGSGELSVFAELNEVEDGDVRQDRSVLDPLPANEAQDSVDALRPLPGVDRDRSLFGDLTPSRDREDNKAREEEEPFERDG